MVPWAKVTMPSADEAIAALALASAIPRALGVTPEAAVAVLSNRQSVTAVAMMVTAMVAAVVVAPRLRGATEVTSKGILVVPSARTVVEAEAAFWVLSS